MFVEKEGGGVSKCQTGGELRHDKAACDMDELRMISTMDRHSPVTLLVTFPRRAQRVRSPVNNSHSPTDMSPRSLRCLRLIIPHGRHAQIRHYSGPPPSRPGDLSSALKELAAFSSELAAYEAQIQSFRARQEEFTTAIARQYDALLPLRQARAILSRVCAWPSTRRPISVQGSVAILARAWEEGRGRKPGRRIQDKAVAKLGMEATELELALQRFWPLCAS